MTGTDKPLKLLLFSNGSTARALINALKNTSVEIVGLCTRQVPAPKALNFKPKIAQILYDLKLTSPKEHLYHSPSAPLDPEDYPFPVFGAKYLKTPDFIQKCQSLSPDLILCFGFHRLIPSTVLNTAKRGGINIHPGKLPERGGGTPLRWAVYYNDSEIALTAHDMVDRFDAGQIILEQQTTITDTCNTAEAEDKLPDILPLFINDLMTRISAETQIYNRTHAQAPNILPSFRGEHCVINWKTHSAKEIERICLAAKPKSGAITYTRNQTICFWNVEVTKSESSAQSGTVVDFDHHGHPIIQTCQDAIILRNILHGSKIKPAQFLKLKRNDLFL